MRILYAALYVLFFSYVGSNICIAQEGIGETKGRDRFGEILLQCGTQQTYENKVRKDGYVTFMLIDNCKTVDSSLVVRDDKGKEKDKVVIKDNDVTVVTVEVPSNGTATFTCLGKEGMCIFKIIEVEHPMVTK